MKELCKTCINQSELQNPDIDRICDDCQDGSIYKQNRVDALEQRNKIYLSALIELYKDAPILAVEDVRSLILKAIGIEKGCSSCRNTDFHRDPDSVCDRCKNFSQWICDFTGHQK